MLLVEQSARGRRKSLWEREFAERARHQNWFRG